MSDKPRGELTTRTIAMPADSNPAGDIFGGWVLSQMDIAAGICAGERRPVKIGDILCVYTEVKRVGNTSLEVHVEAWVQRDRSRRMVKVTQANFTFVALDGDGRPRKVRPLEDDD
jgi:acyl-CoA thioesterase YciA